MTIARSHPAAGPLALLLVAAAAWGIGTVISKAAVETFPPLTLLTVQLATSVAILAVVAVLRREPRTPVPGSLARLGLLNPGLGYALSLAGLTQIDASLSVLLWAAEPILIVILARIWLGEQLGVLRTALVAVAAVGLTLVMLGPGTTGSLVGIVLTLAGVVCCAIYSVATRAQVGVDTPEGPVVRAQQRYALGLAAILVVVIAVTGRPVLPAAIPPTAWLSAIASGVIYFAVAYLAYLGALRHLPVSVAAASFFLIPLVGVAGGILILGERLDPLAWLGAGLVLVAVAGILRPPTRAPSPVAV